MLLNAVRMFIGCFIITGNHGKDLKGGIQKTTDYESAWSPEGSSPETTSEPLRDYENSNVDQMVAVNYEITNVNQMVTTNYENTNVDQMVATNYENLPPQNSGTYESVRSPDSSHIYDALSKEGIYK